MALGADRWVEISPSQFTHEAEGLHLVRDLLPDRSPFRAWSNFEFRDSRGRWHEVDLLVLGRGRLHLVELKYYSGILRGNDYRWLRDGHRAEDSPLLLARRKAQYLATKLQNTFTDWARRKNLAVPDPREVVPFIQESVFLHHPALVCELPASSAINLFGLDTATRTTNLPGIGERLLEESRHEAISPRSEQYLAAIMAQAGLVQRRERTAGSWTITDQALASGPDWQEWLAFHVVAQQERARIRFTTVPEGAPVSERQQVDRRLEHEFRLMSRLQHDGLLVPRDLVTSDGLGTGLVYDDDESWQRLDLWLADHDGRLPLTTQLSIIRQIGEVLQYAHANKVVHRALSPHGIWVRDVPGTRGEVKIRVGDWGGAGLVDTGTSTRAALPGVTALHDAQRPQRDATWPAGSAPSTSAQPGQGDAEVEQARWVESFHAPEGPWSATADRIRIDVFGFGALAFYVLTGRAAASSPAELVTRLAAQGGLDLAVELPQISTELRGLVLAATDPTPTRRTGDVHTVLTRLDAAEAAATRPEEATLDPLEATPGAVIDGRFTLVRRLGQGSTAVGLLVSDASIPEGGPNRVLKVALHDDAARRLTAEADTLRILDDPRIVTLLEGPLTVGGRQALLLESAGEHTLAHELGARTRLSLDLLERYGTDLLDALVALDRAGIDHRDIKPANLGVREGRGGHGGTRSRAKHLVLFDFSLTGAAASATSAGTPPYLDPFLTDPTGARGRFDSAAERYAAAVVLFEMATGTTPVYGDDPTALPAAIPDEASIDPASFDASLAQPLTAFFTRALARDAAARHHTAAQMAQEWASVFTTGATTLPAETADVQALAATLTTPLAESGLSARALSALEPEHLATVGDLLRVDQVRISRLRGVADRTRKEITGRAKAWRQRLGHPAAPKAAADRSAVADTMEAAAQALLDAAVATGVASHAQVTRVLLGYGTTVEAMAAQARIAASLPDPVTPGRLSQILGELQGTWAGDETCRAILNRLTGVLDAAVADAGGVLTSREAAAAISGTFSGTFTGEPGTDERLAAGLLRVAVERLRAQRRADESAHAPMFLRRRREREVLLAADLSLLDLAEALGAEADRLVAAAGPADRAIVPAVRASAALRTLVEAACENPPQPPPAHLSVLLAGTRLARLAAAASTSAAASAAGDLHHLDLSPLVALDRTFGESPDGTSLGAEEIRRRVAVRFPALAALPRRPRLDGLLVEAELGFVFDADRRVFHSPTRLGDTTGLASRHVTRDAHAGPAPTTSDLALVMDQSVATRSFLAFGVPADRLEAFERALVERFDAHVVDLTAVLIDALRERAAAHGIPWERVQAADAAAPGSRDQQGLGALVRASWDAVTGTVQEALAADGGGPVALTEAAPLARYGNLALLTRWSDLSVPRAKAVWLVVPQLHANRGALVDMQPVPLASPTQFVLLATSQVDSMTMATAEP